MSAHGCCRRSGECSTGGGWMRQHGRNYSLGLHSHPTTHSPTCQHSTLAESLDIGTGSTKFSCIPATILGMSYGPWYGPLPCFKGSELWAPISKVVYDGVVMALGRDSAFVAQNMGGPYDLQSTNDSYYPKALSASIHGIPLATTSFSVTSLACMYSQGLSSDSEKAVEGFRAGDPPCYGPLTLQIRPN